MKYKFLIFAFSLFLAYHIADAQISRNDTVKYVGKKYLKKGGEKTLWNSRIIFLPDSTYIKADYYYSLDKGKSIKSNVAPNIEHGYWVLRENMIFLYSKKVFLGPDFSAKYKKKKSSLIYEWKAFRPKSVKNKRTIKDSGLKPAKVHVVKPIVKFRKI